MIKDEFKPKEEGVKKMGKDNEIEKLKESIVKNKECLREKDRRIKKIENRFKFIKKTILTVLAGIVCVLPLTWLFSNVKPLYNYTLPSEIVILAMIGILTIALFSCNVAFAFIWYIL